MEIKTIITQVLGWWWFFLLGMVVGLGVALLINRSWQPVFESTKVVVLTGQQPQTITPKNELQVLNLPLTLDDLVAVVQSEEFAQSQQLNYYRLQKLSPWVFRIVTFGDSQNSANTINNQVFNGLQKFLDQWNRKAGLNYQLIEIGQSLRLQESKISPKINLIVGAMAGLVFTLVVFSLILYYQSFFQIQKRLLK